MDMIYRYKKDTAYKITYSAFGKGNLEGGEISKDIKSELDKIKHSNPQEYNKALAEICGIPIYDERNTLCYKIGSSQLVNFNNPNHVETFLKDIITNEIMGTNLDYSMMLFLHFETLGQYPLFYQLSDRVKSDAMGKINSESLGGERIRLLIESAHNYLDEQIKNTLDMVPYFQGITEKPVIEQLKQKDLEYNKTLNEYAEALDKLGELKKRAKLKLDECTLSECPDLANKFKSIEMENYRLKTECSCSSGSNRKFEEEKASIINNYNIQISQLQNEIYDLKGTITRLQNDQYRTQILITENDSLRSEIKNVKNKYDELKQKYAELDATQSELVESHGKYGGDKVITRENLRLRERIKELEEGSSSISTSRDPAYGLSEVGYGRSDTGYVRRDTGHSSGYKDQSFQINKLQEENSVLQAKIVSLDSRVSSLNGTISNLNDRINTLNNENAYLMEEAERLKDNNLDLENNASVLTAQNITLKNKIKNLEEEANRRIIIPLFNAAREGKIEDTSKILRGCPDAINMSNKSGQTALHIAASNGHMEVVRFLLNEGANPDTKDNNGLVALEWASSLEIRQILSEKMYSK